ncbi:MAG: AAA family ATPase [Candidatus Saccharimonadia bacterium]
MKKVTTFMAIGVPGSGKTTYLKPFAERIDAKYLSTDEIRLELLGDMLDHSQNQRVWAELYRLADESLMKSRSVVIDAMNLIPNYRIIDNKRYRGYCSEIVGIWFNFSLEEILRRNLSRIHREPVPESDITRLYHAMIASPPVLSEGFDKIIDLARSESEIALLEKV